MSCKVIHPWLFSDHGYLGGYSNFSADGSFGIWITECLHLHWNLYLHLTHDKILDRESN